MMYIPIILGTAREGRQSEKAATYVLGETQKLEGVETELLDVRDYRTPATTRKPNDRAVVKLSEKATRADAFIVISPVYNHGYAGELKMMLDMLYDEYNRKPVGICGTTAGAMGGVHAVEQLRLVAIELQMVPIREALYFTNVGKLLDEQGNLTDPAFADRTKGFFKELLWYARALKQAREQS